MVGGGDVDCVFGFYGCVMVLSISFFCNDAVDDGDSSSCIVILQ